MNYLFQHKDFEDLLNQTAANLELPFDFVEKDYWVTYILFRMKKAGINDFVFKGGTSLTKGWQLLDRFSEDIDLLFYPDQTKSAKSKRLTDIKDIVSKFEGLTYNESKSGSHGAYRDSCFDYIKKSITTRSPLLPHIKLEMGYRGNAGQYENKKIQSYVGKLIENVGKVGLADDVEGFEIPILDIHRTFVEKLFAIHSAFENKQVPQYYRHYYDVYKLLHIPSVNTFYGTEEFTNIAQDVASRSKKDFPNTKIPTDCDFHNSNAFKTEVALITQIESALSLHQTLFSQTPPSAKDILQKLEKTIYR